MDLERSLKGKNIVLVGAGQLGRMALDLWPQSLGKPALYLDAHREGYIAGIPVERTSEHLTSKNNVYVLSFFKESAANVVSLFRDKFRQEIITVYDVLSHYDPDRFSNGWVGDQGDMALALSNLPFFADAHSKAVYEAAIQWRYKRYLADTYPVSDEAEKYDLRKYIPGDVLFDFVVDGGSYDFSFGSSLAKTGTSWNTLIALEPDPARLDIVKDAADKLGESSNRKKIVCVDQRALWSHNQGCQFYSNGLLSARIARHPDHTCIPVETVTLPLVLKEYGATCKDKILVKLHIEGAEWPVVEASRDLLQEHADINLLINLSHDEDSLVKIPKLLGEIGKYRLYLASHSLFGEGLTLFARTKRT